ncbi:MAG: carboxypeptidase regulatory-like domain-containing protein [Bacteroidales bacterium]|nr:carboxypeptidase regulatory-like domain-containing protein [Bacteroidales bacterium]
MRKLYTFKTLAVLLMSLMAMNLSSQVSTLYGTVSYHNDGIRVIPDVTVLLYNETGNLVATTITNADGYYEFPDLPYGLYTLTGTCDLPAGGVSVVSALKVLKHINGQQLLNPIQQLAADVNNDGQITGFDFSNILVSYLVHGNPFPAGEWIFEEVTAIVDGMKSAGSEKGIGGTSTGDTGGAFDPGISNSPIAYFASIENLEALHNEELSIAIKMDELTELTGMHLSISYPGHLIEVLGIESAISEFDYVIHPDRIILSAANSNVKSQILNKGEEIITLRVRTSASFLKQDEIAFSIGEESHFAGATAEMISPKITLPVINYKKDRSELMANYPNPFSIQTSVNYRVANPSLVNLAVYGMDGKLITILVNEFQAEGIYQVTYKKEALASGTYFLRMYTEGFNPVQDTRVMIITSD